MVMSFEEKGKIFTHVVTKKPIDVVLKTTENLIEGKIHIRPDDRIIDELNQINGFLAVTDARIFNSARELIYTCSFMTVNRSHIIWIIPYDELIDSQAE